MKLKQLLYRRKTEILYLFFGVCTTAVNTVVYVLCDRIGMPNVAAVVAAWVVSVLFAFVTNKSFVFGSRDYSRGLIREMGSFFGARILTGALDVGIMFVAVDCLDLNSTLWKVISNVIVVIANYGFSKLIFTRKNGDE